MPDSDDDIVFVTKRNSAATSSSIPIPTLASSSKSTKASPADKRMDATSSSKVLPTSLNFAYQNLKINGDKWTADCKFCTLKKTKSDKLGTTSNFVTHLRNSHVLEFAKYS